MSESRRVTARNLFRLIRPAALVFFLALEGCATGGRDNPFVESTRVDLIMLRVESRNLYQVSVYINPTGRRQLVGTVPPNGRVFFEFEYPSSRPLRLELESDIGDQYRIPSPPFAFGGRLYLLVNSTLRRSVFVSRSPDQSGAPGYSPPMNNAARSSSDR